MGHNDRQLEPKRRRTPRRGASTKVLFPEQPGQFGIFAPVYLANGFKPFPARDKKPLVSGATGHDGVITLDKVNDWISTHHDAHLCIRAEGWIGVDVDNYDGKQGGAQLEALESKLGVLPETYTSTARGRFSKSRQYFYRVPDDIPRKSRLARDIEIIQRCHRYAAVFPTFHRGTGTNYSWYHPDGTLSESIPRLQDFARLPESWLEFLKRGNGFAGEERSRHVYSGELESWVRWFGDGSLSLAYSDLIEQINAEPHIGHDLLGHYIREIHDYRLSYGEVGGAFALKALYDRYLGTTNEREPQKEWENWIRWVIGADWEPISASSNSTLSSMVRWARRLSTGGSNASS